MNVNPAFGFLSHFLLYALCNYNNTADFCFIMVLGASLQFCLFLFFSLLKNIFIPGIDKQDGTADDTDILFSFLFLFS